MSTELLERIALSRAHRPPGSAELAARHERTLPSPLQQPLPPTLPPHPAPAPHPPRQPAPSPGGGFTSAAVTRLARDGPRVADYLRSIRARVELLPVEDRVLLELVPTGQRSLREVARLLGSSPGVLSRRLKTLWHRLHDPVVPLLMDPAAAAPLGPEARQLGIERHLQGLTYRQLADRHRISVWQVRAMLETVRAYARARTGAPKWGQARGAPAQRR